MKLHHTWAIAVLAAATVAPASAWMGPSEGDPYVIAEPLRAEAVVLTSPMWQWEDARSGLQVENVPMRDGYRLGDAVFRPRPMDYLRDEFARQVQAHPEAAALMERLRGQTLRLMESEVTVGLWIRLNERQQGSWDMVRVRMVVQWEGERFEVQDTQPFRSRARPSPVSLSMKAVVQSLVNQMHLFGPGGAMLPAADTAADPDPTSAPTDVDVPPPPTP